MGNPSRWANAWSSCGEIRLAFGDLLPAGEFDQSMMALTAAKATTRVVSWAMLISSIQRIVGFS
jgi:hypothetical protein